MFISKLNKFIRVSLVVLGIGGLFSCGGFGLDEEEVIANARQYMAEQKLNAAIIELKNLLQNNATHGEARYMLAQMSLTLGDIKTAEKEVRRAIDAGWDEANSQRLYAEILLRLGENDKLRDIAILDHYPDEVRADITGLWAAASLTENKLDEARENIALGENISADADWILQSKIRLMMLSEDADAARQLIAKAIEIYPQDQDFWLLKAALAEKEKDTAAVNSALEKVLELDPPKIMTIRGRQAGIGLVQTYITSNEHDKAETLLSKVLANYSSDPAANYFGALLDFANKDFDAAVNHLSRVLSVAPEHRDSLLLMGNVYYAQNDYTQAAYYLEKATSTTPDNLGAQTLLGKTYLALGQYSDAEERLNMVSRKVQDNPEITALIGISQLKGGKTDAGIAELEKALLQNPENVGIRQELARAYLMSGDAGQAIAQLESEMAGDESAAQFRGKSILILAHLQAGDFDKALSMAQELKASLPGMSLPFNLAGAAYEASQEYASARREYQQAAASDADDILSLLNLGRLDIIEGKQDAAYERFQQALALAPESSAALVGMARVEIMRNQTEQAVRNLEKARSLNVRDIESRVLLANFFISVSQAGKALEIIEEAYLINNTDIRILAVRTAARVDTRHPNAGQSVAELIKLDPDLPYAHYYQAKYKLGRKDAAGARKSLETALKLDPDYLEAQVAMGNLARISGDMETSMQMAKRLQQKRPDNTVGFIQEADLHLINKDNGKAIEVLEKTLGIAQESDVAIKLNKVHQSMGNKQAGYQVLKDWIEAHPDDLPSRYNLAVSYMAVRDYEKAIPVYEDILDIRPGIPAVMNDLAWLYNETGRKGGLELARRAHQLVPQNPAIQDTYGWMLIQSGRIANGVAVLEDAAEKAGQNRDIQYHYAYALNENGQANKARGILDQILADGKNFSERAAAEQLLQKLN